MWEFSVPWAGNPGEFALCSQVAFLPGLSFFFLIWEREDSRGREKNIPVRETRNCCSCMPLTGDWAGGGDLGQTLNQLNHMGLGSPRPSDWQAVCLCSQRWPGPLFEIIALNIHLAIREMTVFPKQMKKQLGWIARDELKLDSFQNGLSHFKIYKLEEGMPWLFIVTSALGMSSLNAYKEALVC